MLNKIRTVLVHNSHPGNIGSSARAMKNMGLETLYLVAPKRFPAKEAFYMASRADDIVENAIVVETVEEAIKDCTLILGSSSRHRALKWHEITPRESAKKIIQEIKAPEGHVALLYGCEQNGLSNETLTLTHYQIVIPAEPHYASLNVAQAVQLLSYEIYVAYLAFLSLDSLASEEITETAEEATSKAITSEATTVTLAKEAPYATALEMGRFYKHLEETLTQIQYLDKNRPGLAMERLKRLFAAARLDKIEVQILRGIFTAIQKRV